MIYFACNLRKQPSADSKIKPRSCNVERHIDDSKVKEKRKRKQNILKKIFFRPPTPNLIDVGKHNFLVEGGYMSALPKEPLEGVHALWQIQNVHIISMNSMYYLLVLRNKIKAR